MLTHHPIPRFVIQRKHKNLSIFITFDKIIDNFIAYLLDWILTRRPILLAGA